MICRRHSSIRKQQGLMMMSAAALILLTTGALIFGAEVQMFRTSTRLELSSLAEIVGSNSNAALTFGDNQTAIEILQGLQARPSILSACIYDRQGKPFATYASKKQPASTPLIREDGMFLADGTVSIYRGIMLDGERIGTVLLVSSRSDLVSRLWGNAAIVGASMLVAFFGTWLLSRHLQRVISDPIVALAEAAQRVAAGEDHSVRVATPEHARHNEIGALIDTFNTMLSEIEARDEKLQRNRDHLEELVTIRTAELRATSRRSAAILDAAADGIFGLDAAGVVTFINPAAERMLQRSANDLLGRELHELLHPADERVARADCPVCSPMPGMRVGKTEFALADAEHRLPVEYTASAISDSEEATVVVVTFRDITARVVVDRMKDEFVSTVSHELRTPLTSIRGSLGLLNTGRFGDLDKRGARMLDIAVTNTDRLVRLINDILDIEKMEAGRIDLNRTTVSAPDLIAQAVETMLPMAEREGVRLIASDSVPATLWADSDRLMQMLTNLLSNAIKFSPRGTSVTIGSTVDERGFVFSVSDQGRGIPEDKLEMVFERFRQVNATDSRDKGGSGLGLAICRSIVNAHGGSIWAERVAPTGTRFQFTIPILQIALAS